MESESSYNMAHCASFHACLSTLDIVVVSEVALIDLGSTALCRIDIRFPYSGGLTTTTADRNPIPCSDRTVSHRLRGLYQLSANRVVSTVATTRWHNLVPTKGY
jgi:hypothetical protein